MKKLSIILTALLICNILIINEAQAVRNPLKEYDLYKDVTRNKRQAQNLTPVTPQTNNESSNETVTQKALTLNDLQFETEQPITIPALPSSGSRRNEILRESSREVYSTETPGWLSEPSFYSKPSINSIIEKYHRSDFAGCLQESISYVRKYPHDTLGYYYLAMSYTKVDDKDNAIAAYEKVISLNANPMIVKYATNGRNCVIDPNANNCFANVNVPDLYYPYRDIVNNMDLTPVDANTLINRNMKLVSDTLYSPMVHSKASDDKDKKAEDANAANAPTDQKEGAENKEGAAEGAKATEVKQNIDFNLPFGEQDEELDKFINAPYGNGLSPKLNIETKQNQLKRLQESINIDNTDNFDIQKKLQDSVKRFDNHKSEIITGEKLAYDITPDFAKNLNDEDSKEFISQYKKQQQEINEINALFDSSDNTKSNNMADLLPYITENNGQKISPEMIQTMMLNDLTSDLSL